MKWIEGRDNGSKLKCHCGSRLFAVHQTEDGDIFVICGICREEEIIYREGETIY